MSVVERFDYANGQPKLIIYQDGHYELRYPNGSVQQTGTWFRGTAPNATRLADTEYSAIGKVVTYYPDKKIKSLHQINSNLLSEGKKVEYHHNGKISAISNYTNGKLNGPATTYAKNGLKLTECYYNMGVLEGTFRTWYASGKLQKETSYKNGNTHGIYISYHQTGHVHEIGSYDNSVKSGRWIVRSLDGNVNSTIF